MEATKLLLFFFLASFRGPHDQGTLRGSKGMQGGMGNLSAWAAGCKRQKLDVPGQVNGNEDIGITATKAQELGTQASRPKGFGMLTGVMLGESTY